MKIQTFSSKGIKGEEMALPKEFNVDVNLMSLAQALHVYEERSHIGLRKAKTRSEVNRTTKKVYKQKGTGGARHGSRRANVFVGGGVALGPRPVRRILTLNDKMKKNAKNSALNLIASEGKLVFVSGISKLDKTKSVAELIKALAKETKGKRFLFLLSEKSASVIKFFKNIELAKAMLLKDANAFEVFKGGVVVIEKEAIETEEGKAKSEEVKAKKVKTVKKTVKKTTKK